VVKLFSPFGLVVERVRNDYVERRDDRELLLAAIEAMRKEFPSTQRLSSAGQLPPSNTRDGGGAGKIDLSSVHDVALELLYDRRSDKDDVRLLEVAISGMLASLDPHSSYLDPKAFRDMQAQTRGEFGGLGIEVTMEEGLVKVVTPIDATPAARAGILANDVITHIDGAPVQGVNLNQAVDKMRGPVNSSVTLKIQRKEAKDPIEVKLTRETIRIRPVRARVEGDDVGYIRITQFNEQTTGALKKAVAEIAAQVASNKLKGYVIDLRNNPGGLLDQVVSASDEFLQRGEIVTLRGCKTEDMQHFNAKTGDIAKGRPMVVLINGGSAAASEIMAGALQDNKRATILGTRSFGKGSLQTIIPLGTDNGALRLTTARYFTPSGRSIQAKGIDPDVEVLQEVPEELKGKDETKSEVGLRGHLKNGDKEERSGSSAYVPLDPKDDKALHRALDLLRSAQVKSSIPSKR
jgi:carboxyl-terminal processing protease